MGVLLVILTYQPYPPFPLRSRDFSSKRAGVEQMLIDLVVKVEPKATEARGFVRA